MKNIKRISMVLLLIVVVAIAFSRQYRLIIQSIESTAKSKEAEISRHIDLSKGFIDLVTIYCNNFFLNTGAAESELYSLLKYDAATNRYQLDAIEGTKYQKISGNLSGIGPIPSQGIAKDEINLALRLNQHFVSMYSKLPDVAWIYYTSKNRFINIFPWAASTDFVYTDDLQNEGFFSCVTPENNPLRESVWTPVYMDHAGKGLMVTLSSPVYNHDTFMGAVSVDLTNYKLCEMLSSSYDIYIMDSTHSVIANSKSTIFTNEVPKLYALLHITQIDEEQMEDMGSHTLKRVGQYYVCAVNFTNAPWKMYVRMSVWVVIGQAALLTLPVLIICMLLFFALIEIEKRRKTEMRLTESIKELTSYETLLENAAKYDFLTSTVNRRGLGAVFQEYLHKHHKVSIPIQFIMGDIDHFKLLNDTFGHAAGDKVLVEIAKIMQNSIHGSDVVCRWGGEEFVIMLPNRTYQEAMHLAEGIRKVIEGTIIPWDNALELKATMTFGVASYDNEGSIEGSISKADSALYMGKQQGRNQVIGYEQYREIFRNAPA